MAKLVYTEGQLAAVAVLLDCTRPADIALEIQWVAIGRSMIRDLRPTLSEEDVRLFDSGRLVPKPMNLQPMTIYQLSLYHRVFGVDFSDGIEEYLNPLAKALFESFKRGAPSPVEAAEQALAGGSDLEICEADLDETRAELDAAGGGLSL